MNNFDLFEAIGGIDSSLIEKCEKERIPSRSGTWVRWGAIAACLCIVLACVICVPLINQTSPVNPDPNNPSNFPTSPDENHLLFANELEKAPSFVNNTIALNQADFFVMTEAELLDYYGIQIAIEGAVPDLKPQSQAFGIYKNAERGVYYDHNTFAFVSSDHSQRLEIAAGKVTSPPALAIHDEVSRTLRQSEIHGVGITVFSYTDGEGVKCYHTEISNNGVAYGITSVGLTQEIYEAAVASLISDNFISADSVGSAAAHTITGIVDGVDETANLITVQTDGALFTVYLAKKEAENYSLGDKVEIIYIGNPITLYTIWRQQLSSIVISRIKPTTGSITKDSDKSASEIANVSIDSNNGGVPESIQMDASKEADKADRKTIPSAVAPKTDSGNSQKDHYGANMGYFCMTDENKDQVVQPQVNGSLDLDKDGTISSADYELSGMSRKEFADKLISNGNVGTFKEAEMVIDGEITVMCGIIN